MDVYLQEHPEDESLFSTLQRVSEGVDLSEFVDRDTFELVRHVYRRRMYRQGEVRRTLRKMIRRSCGAERMVYAMLCKKKVVFRDFLLRLAFERTFGRFRRFFVDGGDAEYEMMRLVHRHGLHEDVGAEAEKLLPRMPENRMYLYFCFLAPVFCAETVAGVLQRVDAVLRPSVASFLPEKDFYTQVSRMILEAGPDEKVMIIGALGEVDKTQLYRALSEACMGRAGAGRQSFRDFVDVMRMVSVDRRTKMLVMEGWMRTFVYLQQLDEFVRLFEQMRRVGAGDCGILECLYGAICRYKRSGELDLEEFLARCEGAEELNPFSVYGWRDVYRVYKR